jgi:hypothetical protein
MDVVRSKYQHINFTLSQVRMSQSNIELIEELLRQSRNQENVHICRTLHQKVLEIIHEENKCTQEKLRKMEERLNLLEKKEDCKSLKETCYKSDIEFEFENEDEDTSESESSETSNIEDIKTTIKKHNFLKSKILKCEVKNNDKIITNDKKYRTILDKIWQTMTPQQIQNTTTFNVKPTYEVGIDGYFWNSKLNLSVQNKDAKSTFREIINMVKINGYSIEIDIELKSGKILNFLYN